MERVCIFIDASNFYHLVSRKLEIQNVDFDFEKFANFLADDREIIKDGKRFYIGTVRENEVSKKAYINETTLLTKLKDQENWKIRSTKLRTRLEKIEIDDRVENYKDFLKLGIKEIEYRRCREKGVDVKLTVDLITGAIDNLFDIAILVSSDLDLAPAVNLVRKRFKKKIEYVGFSIAEAEKFEATRPTKAFIFITDVQKVLTEADLRKFLIKKLL